MKKTAEQMMLDKLNEIDRLHQLSLDLLETDEDASDEAYDKMWKLANEVATVIVKSTYGQITEKTAKYMVFHMRSRLIALCKRFA